MMTGHLSQSNRRSSRLAVVLVLLIPAILAGWALRSYRTAAEELKTARADLAECQRLITDIERLMSQPKVASIDHETSSAITRRVSQSMQTASLPAESLERVEPQTPIRVNRTQYMLRSTRVELGEVTLEQVIRFAHTLRDVQQGLIVRDLVLTEPRSDSGSSEHWHAEITLTQSIFSPTIR